MRAAREGIRLLSAVVAALLLTAGPAAAEPVAPQPPPVRDAAPAGARPGPAPGLGPPTRCLVPGPGPQIPPGPSAADRLRLAEAHELATGAGVVVAVIDTGVTPHPRLARLRGGGDYLAGGDGLDDCDGHGTAVAGLIGASASQDDEVVGIAPDAELIAIRQSSPSYTVPGAGGPRPAGDVATLAEAVVLAVNAGADVINVSEVVCLAPERAAREGPGLQAALRLAADAEVVVVAAAGNAGVGRCVEPDGSGAWTGQVALPGWYDDIVAVGAVGPDDRPAPFTVAGPWVDLAAPGTGLRSLAVGGGITADELAGTSFSAPWVAGLAALLRERYPQLSAAGIVEIMTATARRPAGGRDAALGAGVIDPVAALTAVPAPSSAPALAPVLAGTEPIASAPTDPPVDLALLGLLGAGLAAGLVLRRVPVVSRAADRPSAPPG